MSDSNDRLLVVYDAYSKAYDRRLQDWSEATSTEQAKSISDHVDALETLYLGAAKQALDATGQAIEDAFAAAKEAQKAIDDAYDSAKNIADKIRLVGSIVGKVGDLITEAKGNASA